MLVSFHNRPILNRSILWDAFEVDQDEVSLKSFVNRLSEVVQPENAAKRLFKELDADKNSKYEWSRL